MLIVVAQKGKGSCDKVRRKGDLDAAAIAPAAPALPSCETSNMNGALPADLLDALNRDDFATEFHFASSSQVDDDGEVDDSKREPFALSKHLWVATLEASS